MKTDELVPVFSTAFQKEKNSNNYKLLGTVMRELEVAGYGDNGYGEAPWGGGLEDILRRVKEAHWIDYATDTNLEYFAQLFSITRNISETDTHFRMRIKLQYQKYISHATIDEIRLICATILYTATSRVIIDDIYPAAFSITTHQQDLDASEISVENFEILVGEIKPAAVRIAAIHYLVAFECKGIGDPFWAGSDSTKAYNNIANANPGGGIYAGIAGL